MTDEKVTSLYACGFVPFSTGKGRLIHQLSGILFGVLLHISEDKSSILVVRGTAMKGIYKGVKYTLSHMFVVKEREIEIGLPTNVKHIAHIGWDGSSESAPTWMNEFNTVPDFAAASIGNSGSALSPWSSQDFTESTRQHSGSELFRGIPADELLPMKKKPRRKKYKSTSSPKSNSDSSRSSRIAKLKTKYVEVA